MNSGPSLQATLGSTPAPSTRAGADSGVPSDASGIKRRAPIACRRCRRMRSKCIHDKAQPPCKACFDAGISPNDCIFPVRGRPDNDREYRHPRTRAEKATKQVAKPKRTALDGPGGRTLTILSKDDWGTFPPQEDLIDGVDRFTRHHFQLGFIPKQQFVQNLRGEFRSNNLFLLLSILSVSARSSPWLKARYGTEGNAADYFMDRATAIALEEIYREPALERCQAFFILAIAQQIRGLKNKSQINMGIAMKMAQLMQLHREETYHIQHPTPDLVVRAESARRTMWMLHNHDHLHSGPLSPISLPASDITALLPGSESDFANGQEPKSRAALGGTKPAAKNPALISDTNRSLFATSIQAHHLWGIISRRAVDFDKCSTPWEPKSEFSLLEEQLRSWEHGLPQEHLWSTRMLKVYEAEGHDLSYLRLTMMTRLCNIILRKPYLADLIKNDTKNRRQLIFLAKLSTELFHNVRGLYEQIDTQFTDRTQDESVNSQFTSVCVYSCGLFSAYLCKYHHICQDPTLTQDGPMMLQRSIAILTECRHIWPSAARWVEALETFVHDPNSTTLTLDESMVDGNDPVPHPLRQVTSIPNSAVSTTAPNTPAHSGSISNASPLPTPLSEPSMLSFAAMGEYPPAPPSSHSSHQSSPQENPMNSSLLIQTRPVYHQPQQQQLPQRPLNHPHQHQPQYQQHQQHQQHLPILHSQSSVTPTSQPESILPSNSPPLHLTAVTAPAVAAAIPTISVTRQAPIYHLSQQAQPNTHSGPASLPRQMPGLNNRNSSTNGDLSPVTFNAHHPHPHPHPLQQQQQQQQQQYHHHHHHQQQQQQQQPPSSYTLVTTAPEVAVAAVAPGTLPFYPTATAAQPGQSSDGFEGELQFYINHGSNQEWITPSGWLETL